MDVKWFLKSASKYTFSEDFSHFLFLSGAMCWWIIRLRLLILWNVSGETFIICFSTLGLQTDEMFASREKVWLSIRDLCSLPFKWLMIRFFFFSLELCLVLQVNKLMVVKSTVVACRFKWIENTYIGVECGDINLKSIKWIFAWTVAPLQSTPAQSAPSAWQPVCKCRLD